MNYVMGALIGVGLAAVVMLLLLWVSRWQVSRARKWRWERVHGERIPPGLVVRRDGELTFRKH